MRSRRLNPRDPQGLQRLDEAAHEISTGVPFLGLKFVSTLYTENSMDAALILADQILTGIRASGASKIEAHAALTIAGAALTTVEDVSFRNDLPEGSA